MSQAVRTRLIKGFAAQGFAQAVNLIIQIGSVPLFIHFWGEFCMANGSSSALYPRTSRFQTWGLQMQLVPR